MSQTLKATSDNSGFILEANQISTGWTITFRHPDSDAEQRYYLLKKDCGERDIRRDQFILLTGYPAAVSACHINGVQLYRH